MTDRPPLERPATNITASGLGAVIPAALIAALLAGRESSGAGAVDIDAIALDIVIPPAAITEILRAAQPDRQIDVVLEDSAIVVRVTGIPAIRIGLPPAGLRIRVRADGIRFGE